MKIPSHFNLRVYGVWLHNNHVLLSKETYSWATIIKFPGGGLELGEGAIDGLKREWKEELDSEIQILQHLYTTDFYQPSAYDNSQVISIYYKVDDLLINPLNLPLTLQHQTFYWHPLHESLLIQLTLPIDKRVGEILLQTT